MSTPVRWTPVSTLSVTSQTARQPREKAPKSERAEDTLGMGQGDRAGCIRTGS